MKGFLLASVGLLAAVVESCPGHGSPPGDSVYRPEYHRRHQRRQDTESSTATATSTVDPDVQEAATATATASAVSSVSVSLSETETSSETATLSSSAIAAEATISALLVNNANVKTTILVIARDAWSATQATSGLTAYGIPFEVLLVPQGGVTLPTLFSGTQGNYGGLFLLSGLAYDYGNNNWHSALTDAQMNQLYEYQTEFGVRMVQYDVYPQPAFGTTPIGSCCDDGVEQLISFSNTTSFAQSGLKTGAGMSTRGLYHYVTQITDPTTTWEIARFEPNGQWTSPSTAGVINNFNGREQMAFFTTWATDWSPTSNYLQHAAITWVTRGLYAGFRRVNINAQIDDMMLGTPIYNVPGEYRVVPADMNTIKNWIPSINAKMNPGSSFKPEIGYNGNGNILAIDQDWSKPECSPHPIYTGYNPTDAEFKKPLGTGIDLWPSTPTNYTYTTTCINQDPLSVWFQNSANRAAFFHLSHTYTHEHLNNVTYSDAYKEIQFNQKWFAQTAIDQVNFSPKALIPPAITGLHNGDVLRAWWDLGLRNCVGDNARPALRNPTNRHWPYITNTNTDGFDGFTVIPRWPLRIYWNCDSPQCTLQEWLDTSNGNGGFDNLMLQEKNDMMRYYFGLFRDGVMFHQMNLRSEGMGTITMADGTQVRSLYQAWVEQTVQEFSRLANWPMIALRQDDLADAYTARMARDQCNYGLSYTIANKRITAVTVTASGNTCSAEIPVTLPGTVTNTQGFRTEKVGNDPLTIWVTLTGSPVTFTLSSSIAI
ncbi:hypothetical protein BU24DRAFT_17559 [Aaosphaeria arxii CBS 175.79]|uniref:Extracellular serine-rich protein n=1 Tax=Aaosphaeria arxii CBS 175.79 TaxID=1450172 RepID=A0A6A5Y7N1_9PLEO|nr:uncharacterized protein BU24DRAFT_17559 [Aaosphaeria arxii CBS 175.79]KAF2021233.1 hypothetical protein BU24DRAFT_17559 [Aaosphaeria arxii CBS 175.79]